MTDVPQIDISPANWEIVAGILRKHVPDREVWAFGSRALWTAKEYSDLDLAVLGDSPMGLSVVASLNDDFAASDLPFKVDLVDWATTREPFRKVIRSQNVVVQERSRSGMAGELLSDFTDIVMGQSPPGDSCNSEGNGVPLLNGPTEYGPHHPTPVQFTTHARKRARPGDVLFCVRGSTTGRMNWADREYAIGRGVAAIRHRQKPQLQPFVRAVIEYGLPGLLAQATGSTFPNVSADQLSRLWWPPLEEDEQRAIAHILGTLDDKIELNRRMSETLEAMARALFKSWFVDFDPVRAKAEGRDPGLPQPLADLFPARLVDSELGETPEGWEVAPLPDVIAVNPTRSLRKGDVAPYLDMANMPTSGHAPDEVVERQFGSGMRFVNGDTLVARITPCLENGKTAYVDFLQDGQVGWGSTEYIVLHPKPPVPSEFAYCLARSNEFRDFAIQSMTGSSGRQRVPAESLSHFRVVAAPEPIAELFGRLIKPLFARASAATKEGRTLAALRETLLPKLISGELRVKDAERFIGRAV